MAGLNDHLYEQILDKQVALFLEEIQHESGIDSRKIHPRNAGFFILSGDNKDYYEHKYYEELLEWRIRDYLVTDVFCNWFDLAGIEYEFLAEDGFTRLYFPNERFGERFPIVFILKLAGKRIGYRYSSLDNCDVEQKKILRRARIKELRIIDWEDTNSLVSKKNRSTACADSGDRISYITLHSFFRAHFTESLYNSYVERVREAVAEARSIIGYKTISHMTPRFLSDFKSVVMEDIARVPLRDRHYHIFDESTGTVTKEIAEALPAEPLTIIENRCFQKQLYKSLAGSEPFARCFLTSEYLRDALSKGKEIHFDYSSIAVGYYKSVELLLKKIVHLSLQLPDHECMWIPTIKHSWPKEEKGITWKRKGDYTWCNFLDANEGCFKTQMGSMICFLEEDANKKAWRIERGIKQIIYVLKNYNKGCRNEHLHKDLIDDLATIDAIRDNTIICLLYLLGGCALSTKMQGEDCMLGVDDDSFNRLYKELKTIPPFIDRFSIQFPGQEAVKVIRLYEQEKTQYDDRGNIVTELCFVLVRDFSRNSVDIAQNAEVEAERITLSQTSVPEKMWWYSPERKELTEIAW